MFFANLTAAQFLALFGGAAALLVILYLLDRSRRRQTVPTLRFWRQAVSPVETRRWRIHQPLSLLLQLLSVLLLLLAIAQLRIGGGADSARDHIVILDTSAWMAAEPGGASWMEEGRQKALGYIRAVPAADRVMVIHAGSAVTPATSFESDRALLEEAVLAASPGSGAIRLTEALGIAAQALDLHAVRPGEIVFIGPGLSGDPEQDRSTPSIPNLRYLPVEGEIDNAGLDRVGLRHSQTVSNEWEVLVVVRNDSDSERSVDVAAEFAAAPAVYRGLTLAAGEEQEILFPLRTRAAGELEVRILTPDDFEADNVTVLEVPARELVRVAVHTRRPDMLRPLLAASPLIAARYHNPAAAADSEVDIVILDQCGLPDGAVGNVVWIRPPAGESPVPVAGNVSDARLDRWQGRHPVATGLHTPDLVLNAAQVFTPAGGDTIIAETGRGPVVVARDSPNAKTVVVGFHPAQSSMRNDLSAPLLFANILRWMAPAVFRQWELNSGSAGLITVPLGDDVPVGEVTVRNEAGEDLPFTVDSGVLRFYSGRSGTVTIAAGGRQIVYSMGIPPAPQDRWQPPESARRGVPPPSGSGQVALDLWPWLAALGALGLLAEWLLFGRFRRTGLVSPSAPLRVSNAE